MSQAFTFLKQCNLFPNTTLRTITQVDATPEFCWPDGTFHWFTATKLSIESMVICKSSVLCVKNARKWAGRLFSCLWQDTDIYLDFARPSVLQRVNLVIKISWGGSGFLQKTGAWGDGCEPWTANAFYSTKQTRLCDWVGFSEVLFVSGCLVLSFRCAETCK